MSLTIFRILFFCLVPAGIFILVKMIHMLKRLFNGEVIAEMPFNNKEINFEIKTAGVYAVWHRGRLFQGTAIDKFNLKISHVPSGKMVSMGISVFRPHVNGFDLARVETNRFYAEPGRYRLQVVEGSGVSVFERLFLKLFPGAVVDYTKYFIQVRESRPIYYLLAAIPLFILCGFCIIGGFVAGFMAPFILSDLGIPFVR